MTPQVGDIWCFDDARDNTNHHLLLEEIRQLNYEWQFKTIRLDTGKYDEAYFRKPNCRGWRKVS